LRQAGNHAVCFEENDIGNGLLDAGVHPSLLLEEYSMKLSIGIGLLVLCAILPNSAGFAQPGIITTYAGPGSPVTGSLAAGQAIDAPNSVAPDGNGGFYVAIGRQHRVYWVTAGGKLMLYAGTGISGFSGDGGQAATAQLSNPTALAVDTSGNLFIADSDNQRIRRVALGGIITTVAGDGTRGYLGDGGHANSAELNYPVGIAVDTSGNLFIADSGNNCIRKVLSGGYISTVAGTGSPGFSGDGAEATSAQLNHPSGIAVDSSGNLFIADYMNQRIREVTVSDSYIKTIAGNGKAGFSGDTASATSARFSYPVALALDSSGNIYVADSYNFRVRKFKPGGTISTIAGNGKAGFSGDGGQATSAQLYMPAGVAVDTNGNLFIADYVNRRVREVSANGVIATVAGSGMQGFGGDGGPATSAQMYLPAAVALDSVGNLFIADSNNSRVRKVTPTGTISTVAGKDTSGFSGDGSAATSAELQDPVGIAIDAQGNLFIADYSNQRIRKTTAAGVISTVAGNGTAGFSGDGGQATSAQLNQPWGVAVDSSGNLFVADLMNNRVRKVTPDGTISTVAGIGNPGFSGDGGQATSAQLNLPAGLAVDRVGNLYIADSGNHRIRRVTPGGIISTVAGTGMAGFSGDGGDATLAEISRPTGVAVDGSGDLFIADHDNNRIRWITLDGVIYTVAGTGSAGFSGDGGPATSAQLNFATSVAADSAGNLYIADYDNNRIRKVAQDFSAPNFFPQVVAGSGYSTIFALTNSGSTAAVGTLNLTDPQGNSLRVKGTLSDFLGITQSISTGSSFSIKVPGRGTVFLSVDTASADDQVQVGWGQLVSVTGVLTGVASLQYGADSNPQIIAGTMQSRMLQYGSFAVANDGSRDRHVAYAIANPTSQPVEIQLAVVDQDGTVLNDAVTVKLEPKQQISEYLWHELAYTKFSGSLVVRAQSGGGFAAVVLLDDEGNLQTIPANPETAP
jgi:trimeric autotransporter adhesin